MNRKQKIIVILVAFICLSCIFIAGLLIGKHRGIPFVKKTEGWSIGIYTGESPIRFLASENINNPVLTAEDVTDVPAQYVADPFMIHENNKWYMFFEVKNSKTHQGDIGFATSNDTVTWTYQHIVIDEHFHMSYPYVFKWENEYYMIPETGEKKSIRLYKAINFPTKWILEKTLIKGENFIDNSIVFFNNMWWIFTSTANDNLRLYYASNLLGHWIEHPQSPLINRDPQRARGGGRVIVLNGKAIRYAQDDSLYYGKQVLAFEITELTTSGYQEKEVTENPILKASGRGWNSKGMHTIDPHQLDRGRWVACVDGNGQILRFGLNY